jgi:hypothetical protein
MNRRLVFGLLLAVLLLVGAAGIGAVAFNMGLAQGVAQTGVAEGATQAPLYARPFFYPRPFGFGFGIFGFLFTAFIVFLFFGLLRRVFWRGPMMGPWAFRGGPGHWDREHGGVPPMFGEWHRRAHAQGNEASPASPSATDKPQS